MTRALTKSSSTPSGKPYGVWCTERPTVESGGSSTRLATVMTSIINYTHRGPTSGIVVGTAFGPQPRDITLGIDDDSTPTSAKQSSIRLGHCARPRQYMKLLANLAQ